MGSELSQATLNAPDRDKIIRALYGQASAIFQQEHGTSRPQQLAAKYKALLKVAAKGNDERSAAVAGFVALRNMDFSDSFREELEQEFTSYSAVHLFFGLIGLHLEKSLANGVAPEESSKRTEPSEPTETAKSFEPAETLKPTKEEVSEAGLSENGNHVEAANLLQSTEIDAIETAKSFELAETVKPTEEELSEAELGNHVEFATLFQSTGIDAAEATKSSELAETLKPTEEEVTDNDKALQSAETDTAEAAKSSELAETLKPTEEEVTDNDKALQSAETDTAEAAKSSELAETLKPAEEELGDNGNYAETANLLQSVETDAIETVKSSDDSKPPQPKSELDEIHPSETTKSSEPTETLNPAETELREADPIGNGNLKALANSIDSTETNADGDQPPLVADFLLRWDCDLASFDPFTTASATPKPAKLRFQKSQKPKDKDPQTLIALAPRNSDAAKKFFSMGWKNAQFFVPRPNGDSYCLPSNWNYKDDGVSMRAKIMGEPAYRKLMIEVAYRNMNDPSMFHKAYVYFDNYKHVTDYRVLDKVHRKPSQGKGPKKGRVQRDKEDSFWIINMRVTGATAIGLDVDDTSFDHDSRFLFMFLRNLTQGADPNEPCVVNLRVNAHFGIDEGGERKESAQWVRFKAAQDAIYDFKKTDCIAWEPYCSVRGKPLTQWGSFVDREVVSKAAIQRLEGNAQVPSGQQFESGLIEYPPQVSFSDLDEAAIVFSYGAFLEWRREKEISDDVSSIVHRVAFVQLAGKGIIAVVLYNTPDTLTADSFRVKEGSSITITFKPPGTATGKPWQHRAHSIPNVFNLPFSHPIYLVSAKNPEAFETFATAPGERLHILEARVAIRIPASGAKRQVDAVNLLCDLNPVAEHAQRWRPLLLNQSRGPRAVCDPTIELDPGHEKFEQALNYVLSKISWSEDQIACLRACTAFPNGILMIQGFPGSGKTFLIAAMGYIFQQLGFSVVFGTPTHQAADAICEAIVKLEGLLDVDLKPLRAYSLPIETAHFTKSPTSDAEGEVDATTEPAITDEAQILMLRLAEGVRAAAHKRCYGLPKFSLEAHAVRAVEEAEGSGKTLIGHYPSEEQISLSQGLISFEDVTEFQGPEVDMFSEMRRHIAKMKEEPFGLWEDSDKRECLIAFKAVCQWVASESRILISTNNNTANNVCGQHFGTATRASILFRDEDSKELETNGWIPLTKTVFGSRTTGVVISGDTMQLEPTVLTAQDKPSFNEFSRQQQMSFPARLLKAHHPVMQLREQRRFRPVFVDFLNKRIYNGQMVSHPSTNSLTVNPQWDKMARDVLGIKDPSFDTGHFMLSVDGSDCQVEPSSKSRYNLSHVEAVVNLIIQNHVYGGYKADDIKIITPYSAQRLLYKKALFRLADQLPVDQQPSVETVDSMQGREAKVVIVDFTISAADRPGDLGFLNDDHRCNVAQSRMIEVRVDVIPSAIREGSLATREMERTDPFGEIVTTKVPYICEYAKWAASKKQVVEIARTTDIVDFSSLIAEPEAYVERDTAKPIEAVDNTEGWTADSNAGSVAVVNDDEGWTADATANLIGAVDNTEGWTTSDGGAKDGDWS